MQNVREVVCIIPNSDWIDGEHCLNISSVTFNRTKHIWSAATRELLLDSRAKCVWAIDPTCVKIRAEVVYVAD